MTVRPTRCPICTEPMWPPQSHDHQRRISRDHIMPKWRGGTTLLYGDVRNVRDVCQVCNCDLNDCGNCIGALVCMMAIASDRCCTTASAIGSYGMKTVSNRLRAAEISERRTVLSIKAISGGQTSRPDP